MSISSAGQAAGDRCDRCGARRRPGEVWCSLCLSGPGEPEVKPDRVQAGTEAGVETGVEEPTLPRAQPSPMSVDVEGEAERLLAELSATEAGTLWPSPLRALAGTTGLPTGAVATIAGLAGLALALAALALAGALI